MAYIILENNGVDNTNFDGATFNNFTSGGRSGIVKYAGSECRVFASNSSTLCLSDGELIMSGVRAKITEPEFFAMPSVPSAPIRYQLVAELKVNALENFDFAIFIQTPKKLTQDKILSGSGIYQLEIARFTHTESGIEDSVRTADVFAAGVGDGSELSIGNVATNTLDAGMDAEVDIENRYDEGQSKVVTDFTFSLPKGKNGGTHVNVDGVFQNELSFANDPQTQIDGKTTVMVANVAQSSVDFTSDPQEQIGSLIYDKNSRSLEMNWGYPNGIPKKTDITKDFAKWNLLRLQVIYESEFAEMIVIVKNMKSQSNYSYYWEDKVRILNDIKFTDINFRVRNFVSQKISSGVVTDESIVNVYVGKIWGINQ